MGKPGTAHRGNSDTGKLSSKGKVEMYKRVNDSDTDIVVGSGSRHRCSKKARERRRNAARNPTEPWIVLCTLLLRYLAENPAPGVETKRSAAGMDCSRSTAVVGIELVGSAKSKSRVVAIERDEMHSGRVKI
jgi:hypothetical protein